VGIGAGTAGGCKEDGGDADDAVGGCGMGGAAEAGGGAGAPHGLGPKKGGRDTGGDALRPCMGAPGKGAREVGAGGAPLKPSRLAIPPKLDCGRDAEGGAKGIAGGADAARKGLSGGRWGAAAGAALEPGAPHEGPPRCGLREGAGGATEVLRWEKAGCCLSSASRGLRGLGGSRGWGCGGGCGGWTGACCWAREGWLTAGTGGMNPGGGCLDSKEAHSWSMVDSGT